MYGSETRDGTIWAVSDNYFGGINRFDGEAWTSVRLIDQGAHDIHSSILETQDGTLWVGAHRGFLYAYRNGVWTVYRSAHVPIPEARLVDLIEASDGALWIAGRGQEALRLDYGTSRWTTYRNLDFQCETPDGAHWFVSRDSGVVRYDGKMWTRYGVEDGLMDWPRALIATREGALWAAGADFPDSAAATARFDGKKWSLETHPRLSQGIRQRAVYESSDGSVWFGAVTSTSEQALHGVLRFDGEKWIHYTPPEAPFQSWVFLNKRVKSFIGF